MIDRAFWRCVSIRPAPALTTLREIVIERSEKRMPKWKFRLATDLIVRIQPKMTAHGIRFECLAVTCENASDSMLGETPRRDMSGPYIMYSFDLTGPADGPWALAGKHISRGNPRPDIPALFRMRDRLVAVFEEGRFDRMTPELMLGYHCLYCGKALTDPASQARMIGPECAGTSSVHVPGVVDMQLPLEQPLVVAEPVPEQRHNYRALLAAQMEDARLEDAIEVAHEFPADIQAAFFAALDHAPMEGFKERLHAAIDALPDEERCYFVTTWCDGEDTDAMEVEDDIDQQVSRLITRHPILADRMSRTEIAALVKNGTFRA